jgi:hypothetical protein
MATRPKSYTGIYEHPIADLKTGKVTPTWYDALNSVSDRTNSSGDVNAVGVLTLNRTLVGNGGTDIRAVALTDGQVMIGATSDGTVTPATLTAGTGITVTNGPHGITITSTGFGSLIPLVTGAEPPVLVSDGDGHLILVPAA